MFAFAVGVLLPPSPICEHLSRREAALSDLCLELTNQIKGCSEPITPLIWWGCSDGGAIPDSLLARFRLITPEQERIQRCEVSALEGGLSYWALHSQVLLQIQWPDCLDDPGLGFLNRRLAQASAQQTTLIQGLYPNHDGTDQWQRFEAGVMVEPDSDLPLKLWALESALPGSQLNRRFQGSDGAVLVRSSTLIRSCALSDWARQQAMVDQGRSNRRLMIQGAGLAVASLGLAWRLPSHLPSFLVLVIGAWLLSRQPIRQRAQGWWCMADLIWIQGFWSLFSACRDHEPLLSQVRLEGFDSRTATLMHAHRLATVLETRRSEPWSRPDLTDLLAAIRQRRRTLTELLSGHGLIRVLITLLLALLVITAMAAVGLGDSRLLDVLLVGLCCGLLCVWLGRPIPLVRQDRLQQSVDELDQASGELLALMEVPSVSAEAVQARIESILLRLGEHVVDLCRDGMRAVQMRRRLIP